MQMRIKFLLVVVAVAVAAFASGARTVSDSIAVSPYRPVSAFYTFEAGSASIVDTYLTPLRYSGWGMALRYDRWQAVKFAPKEWSMNLDFGVEVDRTQNIVGNATMWNLGLNVSWGMYRRWKLPFWGLTVGAGGRAHLDAGCLYAARNGNNPASAKAAFTLDGSVYIGRRFDNVLGRVVDLRYVTSVPLTGVFFSPDYGELYYEIYLGNHSGLVHYAWYDRYFRWDNVVMADIHLGNTVLSLGYHCNLLSTDVNSIDTRIVTHAFVIGLGGDWISLSPTKRLSPDAEVIGAIY